jgi:hypothetical protein
MRKIHPADVADAGLVRLGAGMRSAARRRPLPHPVLGRPAAAVAAAGACGGPSAPVPPRPGLDPAAIADAGRVRLGAGMRRA